MEQIYKLNEAFGKITSPSEIFKKIESFEIDFEQENFVVFFLNTKNRVIDAEVLFKGGLDACLIDPRTLFRKALLKNASRLIIAHNHPSGDLTPSPEDRDVYERLEELGRKLDLKILDSIVFNKTQFYSLNEEA